MPKRRRRVVDVDLDGVDDADHEDPDVGLARLPTPTGPGDVMRTDFISSIQSGWRSMSDTTSQTSSIGARIVIAIFISGSIASPRAMRLPIQRSTRKAPPSAGEPEADDRPQAHHDARSAIAAVPRPSAGRPRREDRAGPRHLGEGALAVARLDLDRAHAVDEDVRLVAEGDRVEGGRPDAVVGREPADDDPPDPPARAGAPSSSVGTVAPESGSRIVNPE